MSRRCAECASVLVRNGGKDINYFDLEDGRAVERTARLSRLSCTRCQTTTYDGRPDTVDGFRMTGALYLHVLDRVTTEAIGAVADQSGLARRTISRILDCGTESGDSTLLLPSAIRIARHDNLSIFADANTGRILTATAGIEDPRFAAVADRIADRLVVCDMHHGAIVTRLAPQALAVIERQSIVPWFADRIPDLARRLRGQLTRPQADNLSKIVPILALPPAERLAREAEAVAPLSLPPKLGDFVRRVDAFRAIWMLSGAKRSRQRHADWRASLGEIWMPVFGPVDSALECFAPSLFGIFHDRKFAPLKGDTAKLRGETPARTAQRISCRAWLDMKSPGTDKRHPDQHRNSKAR